MNKVLIIAIVLFMNTAVFAAEAKDITDIKIKSKTEVKTVEVKTVEVKKSDVKTEKVKTKKETVTEIKEKSWFKTTLQGLKTKIGRKFQSRSVRVSNVAAVRADDKNIDPDKPYWKGSITEKAMQKLKAERNEFADAIELVLKNNVQEGVHAFRQFIKNNPDSPFVADVKEAIKKLGADADKLKNRQPAEKSEMKDAKIIKLEEKKEKPAEKE